MPSPSLTKLVDFLAPHSRILVVTPSHADLDAIASASVLGYILKAQGKNVTFVTPGRATLPAPLKPLLPNHAEMTGFRTLRIHLPVKDTPLEEFSYDIREQQLEIELIPKNGAWSQENVSISSSAIRFDALIAINIASSQSLASLVPNEPEWMRALPSVSFSNQPSQETWTNAQIPLAPQESLCEELYFSLKDRPETLTPEVAHTLLTGIISATDAFRGTNVRSRTLQAASELVELGAPRQEIINALWRVVSVPTLNLWGRALMRLSLHATLPLAYTLLSEHDFLQAKTSPDSIHGLGKYLLDRLPNMSLVLVLSAWNGERRAHLFARAPLQANLLARWFRGEGTIEQASWTIDATDLLAAQQSILTTLEHELPRLISSR
ncbi:hypothetical protein KBB27_01050 [Patescibacteria group bacterium]|nr:hypothetical protein [Patescibacteria group bacterium]